MLRHATRAPAADKYRQRCRIHNHATSYTVVRCPGDEFPREAEFTWEEVKLGLRDECWPEGIVFRCRTRRYTVRGGRLVNEQGGLVLSAAQSTQSKESRI